MLFISIIWMIKSNFDYEPIIVFISSIIAILTISVHGNNAIVNGKKNKVAQSSKNNATNNLKVDGDENEIIQL